jgi:anti-sigma factor (TIGR02949 family)
VICDQAEWLHGYLDDELDAVRATEFEAHLEACSPCARALATERSLRRALREGDLYALAPPSLQARVRRTIRRRPRADMPRRALWRHLAVAASLVIVLVGLWQAVPAWREDVAARALAAEVLDAHLRSLQLTRLTDVASSDSHTVKPWFVGKLDFSPEIVDLASDGFPLAGGRLDVVGGQSVAALVYLRRKHVINLFVWPSDKPDVALRSGTQRGYTLVRWTRVGMCHWAVSDLAASELEEFARLRSSS